MSDRLPELSAAELSRYSRHILLDELGVVGQRRLAAARVLVIGAGGLGSPAALYLAAAGIGKLGIADLDTVETHNLQRQLLHDTAAVGQAKVDSAARRLEAINPHIDIIAHPEGIVAETAADIFINYDVVLDGTDNFGSRYVNNDAAFRAKKPLVFGSVFKFEGQVTVFDPAHGGPCYRCLFPDAPVAGSVPGCGEAGVLGALCGVIGSLQALEVIKLITSIGEPLVGRLLTYDALAQRFETLLLKRDPHCPLCGEAPRSENTASVPRQHAPNRPTPAPQSSPDFPPEISVSEARQLLQNNSSGALLVDIREPWETEICQVEGSTMIPMRQIPERADTLPRDRHLLIMCHHGARSRQVTQYLRAHGFSSVSNVAGGIAAWSEDLDRSMARY